MTARVLGWDIGGAHLKLALAEGTRIVAARQVPCALWQGLDQLQRAITVGLDGLPDADRHAVTMTGELADLFPDRASGVAGILDLLAEFLPRDRIAVYETNGGFLPVDAAKTSPDRVGSANWHATARYLALVLGDGLLLDIGSTTTDVVPVVAGEIAARGSTDAERLATRRARLHRHRPHAAGRHCREHPVRRARRGRHGGVLRHRRRCPSPRRHAAGRCRSPPRR